jgi:hypothetical protein
MISLSAKFCVLVVLGGRIWSTSRTRVLSHTCGLLGMVGLLRGASQDSAGDTNETIKIIYFNNLKAK